MYRLVYPFSSFPFQRPLQFGCIFVLVRRSFYDYHHRHRRSSVVFLLHFLSWVPNIHQGEIFRNCRIYFSAFCRFVNRRRFVNNLVVVGYHFHLRHCKSVCLDDLRVQCYLLPTPCSSPPRIALISPIADSTASNSKILSSYVCSKTSQLRSRNFVSCSLLS